MDLRFENYSEPRGEKGLRGLDRADCSAQKLIETETLEAYDARDIQASS